MQFQEGQIYHVYNQGNNHQKIFFDRDNYLFFLNKLRVHILPHADVLAWCFPDRNREPNHFHLEIYINQLDVEVKLSEVITKTRTLNQSIAIILRSYTRAINKQRKRSGSLFRPKTKAECVSCVHGITPSFYINNGLTHINISDPEKQYPKTLFDYIHQNPVKSNLVKNEKDWEFSSAKDYYQNRGGTLINKSRVEMFFDI